LDLDTALQFGNTALQFGKRESVTFSVSICNSFWWRGKKPMMDKNQRRRRRKRELKKQRGFELVEELDMAPYLRAVVEGHPDPGQFVEYGKMVWVPRSPSVVTGPSLVDLRARAKAEER
jgi:hypothetical protein